VSVGSPGSGTEVIALRDLEAAGLDPDHDHQPPAARVGESVQAVKDGALDAFFWSGGVTHQRRHRPGDQHASWSCSPPDQYVGKLKERYGDFYAAAEIEAGGYEGVEAPVKVVAVPNYLVVNRSMDPELAYRLTKLLFDQKRTPGRGPPGGPAP
jgi:TRAP transporter TAXI family solute receptor